jgi:predicted Zn-dependent protease
MQHTSNDFRQRRTRPPPQQPPSSRHRRPTSSSSSRSNQQRPSSSSRQSLKQKLFLLLGALTGLGVWYLTPVSDYAVDFLLTQVPLEADMELGRQALKEQQNGQFPPTMYHPHWTPKLKSVGWQLVESSVDPNTKRYQWDFGVLQDAQTVNAFALPGGVIRITSALLEQLHLTEGELAALIGHEMGHVLHRHSQARILKQQIVSYIFQALIYKDEDPYEENFGEAIGELLLKSADWLGQQSFSRTNEYEADSTSWELLSKSQRYNPKAMQSLLSKLWEYHGRQGGKTSWDSTHPGTLDRMESLEQKWKALAAPEQRKLTRTTIS